MFQPTSITKVKPGTRSDQYRDQELPKQLRVFWNEAGDIDRVELSYAMLSSSEPNLVRASDAIQLFGQDASDKLVPIKAALNALVATWLAAKDHEDQRPEA